MPRAAFLLIALAAAPLLAAENDTQARKTAVVQVTPARNVAMDQLSPPRQSAQPSQTQALQALQTTARRAASVEVSAQLAPVGAKSVTAPQLTAGKPNAVPATALSRRSDSRPLPSAAIAGTDRCDPALQRQTKVAGCGRVLENRASDFARAAPVQSGEQRLLSAQLARSTGLNANSFRLGVTGDRNTASPEDRTAQELATVVPQNPQGTAPTTDEAKQAEQEAKVADILTAIGIQAPAGN